jgi:hypothetical protein
MIILEYNHYKCRRPESNRYGRLSPQDFKSCASACSATPALNGTNRARTYDPLLVRQMLSQLSYDPKGLNQFHFNFIFITKETTQKGLEPSTSAVTGRRSNQLSHWALLMFWNGPSGT